ncbi:MAG: VWA domain-containing protein, partial [Polyangiales bacterium]
HQVRCASHATQCCADGDEVVLTLTDVALDRDLAVDVLDRAEGVLPTVTVRVASGPGPDGRGPAVRATVSPPAFADEGLSTPRTVLFLVDRSGSMEGRPMEAAKRAVRGSLRALGSKDRFNLIAFDDRLEALARSPRRFDDAALQAADAFVLALDARGGTEASQALKAVLTDNPKGVRASMPDKGEAVPGPRLRLVVFMTDGDVADAASVLRTAGDALNHTRLHVLGIGDAVNHALLAELAELGGGTYTPVSSDEDLERAIHALKLAMDAPLWTGVTATLRRDGEERALDDLEPGPRLDLFAGRPVTVAWRGAARTDDTLVLRGLAPDGRVRTLEVPLAAAREEPDVHARWAAMRARRWTYRFQPADDDALTTLGATYGLVTRGTALVAVDPAAPGRIATHALPVSFPLPRNVDDAYDAPFAIAGASTRRARAGGPKKKAAKPSFLAMAAPVPASAFDAGDAYPMMDAMEMEFERADTGAPMPAPPPAPTTAPDDDTAALRALMLSQRADGLFGDVALTLASVAALVSRGHTHREGDFRAELKRTLATLRGRAAGAQGEEALWLHVAIALLTVPHGATPEGLDPSLDALARGLALGDPNALRQKVIALMGAVRGGWDGGPAAAVRARFLSA